MSEQYDVKTAATKTSAGAVSAGTSAGVGFLVLGMIAKAGWMEFDMTELMLYGTILTGAINGVGAWARDLVSFFKNKQANV